MHQFLWWLNFIDKMNTYHIVFKLICLFLLFGKQTLGETCYTPDKQQGNCVPLIECPKVFETFANPLKGSETYLRRFLCKDEQQLKVCCGTAANFTALLQNYSISDPTDISKKIIDAYDLPNCDPKSITDIDLPIILTENVNSDVEPKKCLGIMANSRYVITAARCVVPNTQGKQFAVVGVQLRGKNNNSLSFGVEEIISHPFFDQVNGVNDIALLRLNQSVANDVASLCKAKLENFDLAVRIPILLFPNLNLSTIERGLNKTTISNTALSKEDCEEKFSQKRGQIVITEYDLCISKPENATKSSCSESTGVPLFIYDFEVGFIVFSSSRTVCDDDGLPDIYVNVIAYSSWLREQMRPWPDKSEPCTTPNAEVGECWYVLHCPALLNAFSGVTSAAEAAHLSGFICEREEGGRISVCCVKSSNSTIVHKKDKPKPADVPTKFLEPHLCGLQHRDDYFSSSTAIAIDEFPWIGLIDVPGIPCTGTLINARYVLTTAECAKKIMENITIIRFGNYDQFNETSCVEDPDIDATDCTEAEIYGVEVIILHPFYIPWFAVNDISLLRLNKTVSYYSDFVRPICLPVPETLTAKAGDTIYMSSWGIHQDGSLLGIKKKVLTQLIDEEECLGQFRRKNTFNYIINFNRICTIDYQNNTELFAYVFDAGGSLMFADNYRWHIEGLVFRPWTGRYLPVVYVNVLKYVNWILDSMEPW